MLRIEVADDHRDLRDVGRALDAIPWRTPPASGGRRSTPASEPAVTPGARSRSPSSARRVVDRTIVPAPSRPCSAVISSCNERPHRRDGRATAAGRRRGGRDADDRRADRDRHAVLPAARRARARSPGTSASIRRPCRATSSGLARRGSSTSRSARRDGPTSISVGRSPSRYGLARVVVAPTDSDLDASLGPVAAEFVDGLLRSGLRIGISWGRTLAAVVRHLRPGVVGGLGIAQLAGGVDDPHPGHPGPRARPPDGRAVPRVARPLPARARRGGHRRRASSTMLADRTVKRALDAARRSEVALVGVGAMDEVSTLYMGGHVPRDDWAQLLDAGAVGNVNTRFFDATGEPVTLLDRRTIAISWDELRSVPTVVAIAAGVERADAIPGSAGDPQHRHPGNRRGDCRGDAWGAGPARRRRPAPGRWRQGPRSDRDERSGWSRDRDRRRHRHRGGDRPSSRRRWHRGRPGRPSSCPVRRGRRSIGAGGGPALAIPADLEDPAAPARIVAAVVNRWGRLDVVVNDAAVIKNLPLEEMPLDVLDQHLAVNIRAQFLLVQAALPSLRASGSGASSTSPPRRPAWRSPARRSTG